MICDMVKIISGIFYVNLFNFMIGIYDAKIDRKNYDQSQFTNIQMIKNLWGLFKKLERNFLQIIWIIYSLKKFQKLAFDLVCSLA